MAKRKEKQERRSMVLEPDAAGIDIGAEEIYVAVPPDRATESTRRFSSFTRDLHALADWLGQCRIQSVAMESTGVYWIPLFQILEERGFKVYLVNAHYLKSVPGRKSDVSDCQWIQYLHSVGLLRASFRPPDAICALRTLWRHRGSLLEMAAEHILHMQKALSQMNLQLHHVLSDITGTSGQAIFDGILSGQRDPVALAQLCHRRVQSPRDKVAQALVGDYRPEHLFTLKQSLEGYRYYQKLILELDQETARLMQALPSATEHPVPPRTKATAYHRQGNDPQFDLRSELAAAIQVDHGVHAHHSQQGEFGVELCRRVAQRGSEARRVHAGSKHQGKGSNRSLLVRFEDLGFETCVFGVALHVADDSPSFDQQWYFEISMSR